MKAVEFLKQYKELELFDNYLDYIDIILKEMEDGLNTESSIPMIVSYLSKPNLSKIVPNDKKLVIDAGGTNFRCAVGYFDENNKAVVENVLKAKMPGTQGILTKDEFFYEMANIVKPLVNYTNDIGFCFSYQVKMQKDIDGICLPLTKEVEVKDIEGALVGKELLKKMALYNNDPRNVVILNDTVATLLGGMAKYQGNYSGYVGYIYGTGTNLCYIEQASNVKKEQLNMDDVIINTEFANFSKYPYGIFDKLVIENSNNGYDHMVEKISAGKYLSSIIFEALNEAIKKGYIKASKKLENFELYSVSKYLDNEDSILNEYFTDDDSIAFVKELCDVLIKRAALMGALGCGTAAIKSGNKNLPVAVICEGTTFYHLPGFKKYFEEYTNIISNSRNIKVEILNGTDLNLEGSLLATLVK